MTIQTETNKIVYDGLIGQTVFAYNFRVDQKEDMNVYLGGVIIAQGDWTIDGVGEAVGGNVTLNTPLAVDQTVTLLREVDETQLIDYQPFDAFPAEVNEQGLDKLTMMVQQVSELVNRNPIPAPDSQPGDVYDAYDLPYTALFTGAVERTSGDKHNERVSVADFGAKGSGSGLDETAELQAALTYVDGSNAELLFPNPPYTVTSTLSAVLGGFTLTGLGGRVTTIVREGDYGDTFNFSRTTPLTNRIGFITVRGLRCTVNENETLPTSGAHLHFVRPQVCEVYDCDISEGFGGLHCEGGAGLTVDKLKINSGQFYSSLQTGSYFVKFTGVETSGNREFPSEIIIDNFNWRTGGQPYIENGIIIEASDGIFFTGGHVGFTAEDCARIEPTVAADSLNGVNFTNVHFDGNFVSKNGVHYTEPSPGFHTGAAIGHTFTGCQYSITTQHGLHADMESLIGLSITGGRCSANGEWGMRFSAGKGFSSQGVVHYSNGDNTIGTGHVLFEGGASDSTVDGVFTGAAYRGVQINANADRIRVNGVFDGLTAEDVSNSSPGINNLITGITTKSNTIPSAAALDVPLVGNFFSVSGTTDITSILGSSRFPGRTIVLRFSGVLTVFEGATLILAGNFTTSNRDTITLTNNGSAWFEVSRSVNN